ncbi:MAG: N-carbamoylputrescine amidase [Desulfobacteraceae bacterium]|jgi:N-carbamoylputrescine amidase|nr:N-carbamoylputrescine amidase [Desulfobacteraceae bacterium]
MTPLVAAAVQMRCTVEPEENIAKAERFVRAAAARGARLILLQELFETLYFCQVEKPDFYDLAVPLEESRAVRHFASLARELDVVLPISFYERKNQAHFNTVAVVDADGSVLGVYRKTHLPDGPGYEEKYYFNPGNTGFKVWDTRAGRIGVGICWDQWFPETARSLALMGAEILLFPTAIGSEPHDPDYDSRDHWQLCMRGHAAANMMPVIAANRVGTEHIDGAQQSYYGSSFITDHTGRLLAEMDRNEEGIILADLDLDAMQRARRSWGIFRDRRPNLYGTLVTCDGATGLAGVSLGV